MLNSNEANTFQTLLSELANDIAHTSAQKGFWDYYDGDLISIPIKLALIHDEVSEALQVHRKRYADQINMTSEQDADFTGELADIVIRVLDLAGFYNFDIAGHIVKKVEQNRNRPYKHNKRY